MLAKIKPHLLVVAIVLVTLAAAHRLAPAGVKSHLGIQ